MDKVILNLALTLIDISRTDNIYSDVLKKSSVKRLRSVKHDIKD